MSFCPDCALRGKISGLQFCDAADPRGGCHHEELVLQPGELMYSPEHAPGYLYCLKSGYMLLSRQQAGHIIPVTIHQGAQLLGTEMIWKSGYVHWAEALNEVVYCLLPKSLFFDETGKQLLPKYQSYFMGLMLANLGQAENRLLAGHRMNLQDKLTVLLQQLADSKHSIPLSLLRERLPVWLGYTPQQVERTLEVLYNKGILKAQGQDCLVRHW